MARIGEMIAYQSYNIKSPLNGEAARWVTENQEQLPLDPVSLLVEDRPDTEPETAVVPPLPLPKPESTPALPAVGETPVERLMVECPQCQARLRVPATAAGKQVRCPKCQAIIPIPTRE